MTTPTIECIAPGGLLVRNHVDVRPNHRTTYPFRRLCSSPPGTGLVFLDQLREGDCLLVCWVDRFLTVHNYTRFGLLWRGELLTTSTWFARHHIGFFDFLAPSDARSCITTGEAATGASS